MDLNYLFFKLRKTYKWDEEKLFDLYRSVDYNVSPLELFSWMKQEQYEGFQIMPDQAMSALLNAFVAEKRGKKEGQDIEHEEKLNNNIVFRKLKIALSLKDEDIVQIMAIADMRIGKAELNAFFRDTRHPHYRPCKDQFLRNFVRGLELQSISKNAQQIEQPESE